MFAYDMLESDIRKNDVVELSVDDETSLTEDTVNLVSTLNASEIKLMKMNNLYQLIDTIRTCGIDKSVLFLYNNQNQLSKITGVKLPSLEEFNNGAVVDNHTANLVADRLIVAMEGDSNLSEFAHAYVDDLFKPFRAGWRWWQSSVGSVIKLKKRISSYIDELESNKSAKLHGDADLVPIGQLKKLVDKNLSGSRSKANGLIIEAGRADWSSDEATEAADKMRSIRDNVREQKEISKQTINSRTSTDISRLSIPELISLGRKAIGILDSIITMEESYPGFFAQGWRTGKVHAMLSGVLKAGWRNFENLITGNPGAAVVGGIVHAASVYFHRGIISTTSVGWQVLSYTVEVDMSTCREIARTLRICSEKTD